MGFMNSALSGAAGAASSAFPVGAAIGGIGSLLGGLMGAFESNPYGAGSGVARREVTASKGQEQNLLAALLDPWQREMRDKQRKKLMGGAQGSMQELLGLASQLRGAISNRPTAFGQLMQSYGGQQAGQGGFRGSPKPIQDIPVAGLAAAFGR